MPATTDELRALLHEHPYVEGAEEYIQLEEQGLRVRTDDRIKPFVKDGG